MSVINDTIVALATPPGIGAIGIIRISGTTAISIVNELFKGKDLLQQASHTLHYGTIRDQDKVIDEVVVSLFRAPNSYTKEDVVEVSCHGSSYILNQVMLLMVKRGARLARPGEFTQRAFLSGRFDLAQAEAVADLIAAENEAAQRTAMNQLRGGISNEIKDLRDQLVHFASMIELELDFVEEDVEFADRTEFLKLVYRILDLIKNLIASFSYGNAIKNGLPTVIAGKPNAGKSTLLNAMLNEEKAIVSNIPGTTRDFIEDQLVIDGLIFRFIDTAGIRETADQIESEGVARTRKKMEEAHVILYLFDLAEETTDSIKAQLKELKEFKAPTLLVGNKSDIAQAALSELLRAEDHAVLISAKEKEGLTVLKDKLKSLIDTPNQSQTVITNTRHLESLHHTQEALDRVVEGINVGLSNDLVAQDIRTALFHLGEITGEVTTDDLLDNIFSKFCIGK